MTVSWPSLVHDDELKAKVDGNFCTVCAHDCGAINTTILQTQPQAATARVLCVGAGGIGCELLKTLVMSGFLNLEVVRWVCSTAVHMHQHSYTTLPPPQIDMDTIETSNLNRQFLFRRRHVGQSKAKVAAEAVQRFNPKATIVAHQVGRCHAQGLL